MKKTLLVILLALTSCVRNEYQTNQRAQCPSAFWVPPDVAAEFKKYPEGSPMREFFKHYIDQQRKLDIYYTPGANPDYLRSHTFYTPPPQVPK